MKQLVSILLAVAAGGALVWFFQNRSHNESPEKRGPGTAPNDHRPDAVAAASTATSPRASSASPAPSAADKAVAALKDDVLVSFGKVEDIARNVAAMLGSEKELAALLAIEPAARNPEQRRQLLELERQRAATLGMLPEITRFQDNPDEYARFFGSLVTQAGSLDAAQSKSVTDYMRSRGQEMIAAGLNAAKEPTDSAGEEVWEDRRDQFNEETAAGVAKLLPPGEAERIGFTPGLLELMEQDFDKAK